MAIAKMCGFPSAHAYNIIIDLGVGSPGCAIVVLHGLNSTNNIFLYMLMGNVQIPGSNRYDNQVTMHTGT